MGTGEVDSRVDPFAPREGKALVWKNINMTLTATGNEPSRSLLRDVWGEVPAGDTTAVMGPSGAGKSSLLNILCGRTRTGGRLVVESDIRLSNYSVDPTNIQVRKSIAFVAQDDSLQITSTPREAIRFSAKLRLSKSTTDTELDQLVERMLEELGLLSCADTYVGGGLVKGISGGERKRTSVGVELVTKPTLVFLDEPTSGLDSFAAVKLCQVLKKVANAGASVLFTIHQPSSEIFDSFDHLILMNKGRVMYQGKVSDVSAFFGERQHPCPPNYNPADWIMKIAQTVSVEELDKLGFFPSDKRDLGDALMPAEGQDALGITLTGRGKSRLQADENDEDGTPGLWTQTKMLYDRELKNLVRNVGSLASRFGITIFLSLLYGCLFYQAGASDPSKPSNVNSRFGALIIIALGAMFGTAQPALMGFPTERPVFLREYSTNHYSVIAYFLSRLSMEAFVTAVQVFVQMVLTYPLIDFQGSFGIFYCLYYVLAMGSTAIAVLIGCSIENPKLAQEMLPMVFGPQLLFAGFFVPPSLMPVWLAWARYLFALTYAIRILLLEEFGSCQTDYCQDLLDNVDAKKEEAWWYWMILIVLFVVLRAWAFVVLQKKAAKFY